MKYETKEKMKDADIFIVISIMVSLLLIFVIYLHISELILVHTGEQVTVQQGQRASIIDEEGRTHYVSGSGFLYQTEEGTVTLYYYPGKENDAQAKTQAGFWIVSYLLLVPLDAFFIRLVYMEVVGKRHSARLGGNKQ